MALRHVQNRERLVQKPFHFSSYSGWDTAGEYLVICISIIIFLCSIIASPVFSAEYQSEVWTKAVSNSEVYSFFAVVGHSLCCLYGYIYWYLLRDVWGRRPTNFSSVYKSVIAKPLYDRNSEFVNNIRWASCGYSNDFLYIVFVYKM